ncbi:hypothetical protein GJAV_G00254920 [Gymnothorax javanicus]|nr:hypothetical protein GJAV_G00254920 [Gymnothorax javanicus]
MDTEGDFKVSQSCSVLPLAPRPLPQPRPFCVGWLEGSAPRQTVAPPLLAPGPSLAEEFSSPAVIGHLDGASGFSASPGSVRKMLLSLLDGPGGRTSRTLPRNFLLSHRDPPASGDCSQSDSDSSWEKLSAPRSSDSEDDGFNEPGVGEALKSHNARMEGGYFPPRISPVLPCRRRLSRPRRSLARATPAPSGATSLSRNRRRAQSAREGKTSPVELQPLPPWLLGKPRCTSLSANLNRFLGAGLQLSQRGPGTLAQGSEEVQEKTPSQPEAPISAVPREDRKCSENLCSPDDVLKASCDMEKENAHFVVADMVLEALEGAKWAMSVQRGFGVSQGCADCLLETSRKKAELCTAPPMKHSGSTASSDSGYAEWCTSQYLSDCSLSLSSSSDQPPPPPPPTDADNHQTASDSDSNSASSSSRIPTILCSAEVLALQLVSVFKKQCFAANEFSLASLNSALQEFFPCSDSLDPEDFLTLAREIRQKSRMRGTSDWAPPRFQIIFSTHPIQKRSVAMASQHHLCAGCGTPVENKYLKRLKYCEYLGRYFCECCHSNGESVIPGHVLEKWDFGRYPVCNFSQRLLDSVWRQPLFSLAWVSKNLGSRARELGRFMEVQEQLMAIKRLLSVCRLSDRVLLDLEQLPAHLTQAPVLLSMDDLQRIKRGQLVSQARALLRDAIAHVEGCQICLARGFICEFCRKKEVLFPFQTSTCKRCKDCKSCFHIECFRDEDCPKCRRIQSRQTARDNKLNSTPD